ncbi:hypothetical protein [Nitrosovibrio tenuis]|uniref:Baseplate J-like protein n=1 Tax=Nitrosovibrio tenuis TaxID=1233 RepID=A0A1H7MNJ4_9PROT|nr:hypothetical protein [Nitrosovibrio tenuis]SEL12187.1 hypothetical protein SAMN05216387_105134 [Nitrosovibrio tenuis]
MLTTGLDDRTFDDLVGEAINLLPTLAPEWTNHNPSDPGITLVELLAYFTEILVYRLGRITPATRLQFLKLLGGPNWEGLTWEYKLKFLKLLMGSGWEGWRAITQTHPRNLEKQIDCAVLGANPDQLKSAIDGVIRNLMRSECAVTAHDFEHLAKQFAHEYANMYSGSMHPVRTLCVPSVNLENNHPGKSLSDDRAHVSVVLVPGSDLSDEEAVSLRKKVQKELSRRCLLTTRLHVVAPVYLHLAIGVKLAPKPGQSKAQLSSALREMLEQRFGSQPGQGPLGEGWPFGRALRISELIQAVDEAAGVDYVGDITILQIGLKENLDRPESALGVQIGVHSTIGIDTLLGGPSSLGSERLLRNDAGRLVSIALKPWELLHVSLIEEAITLVNTQTNGERDIGEVGNG